MRVANSAGLTGAQVARAILDANSLSDVRVEPIGGILSDHYDPRSKTVRLSEGNFGHANIAGIAALPSSALQWGAFALALIGVFLVLRRGSTADSETAGAHAAA